MGLLLRARAEQLCGRRAAERRNELAASKFIEFHSIPSRQGALQDIELPKITQRHANLRANLVALWLRFNLLVTTRRA